MDAETLATAARMAESKLKSIIDEAVAKLHLGAHEKQLESENPNVSINIIEMSFNTTVEDGDAPSISFSFFGYRDETETEIKERVNQTALSTKEKKRQSKIERFNSYAYMVRRLAKELNLEEDIIIPEIKFERKQD